MSTGALLAALRARGIRLAIVGGQLRVTAPAGVLTPADRETLREHKDDLLTALADNEGSASSVAELVAGLTPDDRARFDAEVAAGDVLARLVLEALAEPPAPPVVEAVEDAAVAVTRALAPGEPGWTVVYSAALGDEVVFVRDADVVVPDQWGALPRFDLAELAILAEQRPDAEHLRAVVDVKREIPGTRVVRDADAPCEPRSVPGAPARPTPARRRAH